MKTIDDRIAAIETAVRSPIAGTQLTRCQREAGIGWCLGVGGMHMPKQFFYGASIEETLSSAEQAIFNPDPQLARASQTTVGTPSCLDR